VFERRFELYTAIDRLEQDLVVIARFDAAFRKQIDGEVDGRSTFVKKEKGRNVDGTAGKVNSRRRGSFNYHWILLASKLNEDLMITALFY
jgi:hypothetical protein